MSLLRVSRVVSGRERRHSKGQGRQCPAFSVHSKTLHTLHSPLVASCPTRAKEWRSPKEHRLTWSVSFFSRAWSRLRASSNWPPSCWLASPLIRPPGALKLRSLFRQNDHYSPSILSSFWSRTSLSCVWARPVETGEKAAGQIRTEEEDTTTCQVQWTSSPHCTQ